MGVINAENTLKFKSSRQLFDRIKLRLQSYDAMGLIDDESFHDHVIWVLSELGLAVFKECEAVLEVCDRQAKMPSNFYMFYSAYKCTPDFDSVPSINEQRPVIYYINTELSQECPNKCCIQCTGTELGKTKVVVRTFVNGDEYNRTYRNPVLLRLSPNVKCRFTEDCLNLSSNCPDEITIDDDGILTANFKSGSIYIQYYGIPFDENELPMIPDQPSIEKAIEYYIYTQLFEEFHWNSTVPNVVNFLADARNEFENKHMPQARYWAKLPSFQKMVNAIRRSRSRRKFFYMAGDRTITYSR